MGASRHSVTPKAHASASTVPDMMPHRIEIIALDPTGSEYVDAKTYIQHSDELKAQQDKARGQVGPDPACQDTGWQVTGVPTGRLSESSNMDLAQIAAGVALSAAPSIGSSHNGASDGIHIDHGEAVAQQTGLSARPALLSYRGCY